MPRVKMDNVKNIVMIAHDSRKKDLLEWVEFNRDVLREHKLFATGTTGALIAQHTDPAAVHTPGFVEFDDMPALYSMARALVFPSRYESFGIPIVEAMASGCPVITATTSACPEVAGDAAILVDPDDVEGLADAMYRVSLDDALAEDLRQRGLRRSAGFSWSASAKTLLAELEAAARRA